MGEGEPAGPVGPADWVRLPFPSPTQPAGSTVEVLLGYLDYFRSALVSKLDGLSDAQLRTSALPSGWTPLELLQHLTHVELRWLEWGFEGREIAEPWADSLNGRWHVPAEETLTSLLTALAAQAARSRAVVEAHDLTEIGRPGERWDGVEPASLERILLHLLQEYARHAGHLDIVRELLDGQTGK